MHLVIESCKDNRQALILCLQYCRTEGYDKPFAVTYLNTSSFAVYMIPFACVLSRRKQQGKGQEAESTWSRLGFHLPRGSLWRKSNSNATYSAVPSSDTERDVNTPASRLLQEEHSARPSSIDGRRPRHAASATFERDCSPLDLHETAILALQFMFVWFLANYCLNLSLKLTSVASATTLSSASGFFTLALGAALGVEAFSFAKLAAVVMSFFGVLMVTRADASTNALAQENSNPYLGDLLALSSAFFYAVYVVLLKKRIGDESRVSMPLFFGFVGVLDIALMWPVGLVLHSTGAEVLQWPRGGIVWAGLIVNMCITFISDMAYLIAMLKSSPLVATIGLSLTIPLALLGDLIRGAHTGGAQSYLGSSIVLISFVGIGLADRAIARRTSMIENNERHSRRSTR